MFKIKKDKYRTARGGSSHLLEISCRKCGNEILIYQKDGPGSLKRLYLDRIFAPDNLINLQTLNLKDIPVLKCKKCKEILGIPFIYKKEKRKAFRLFVDAVIKKVRI